MFKSLFKQKTSAPQTSGPTPEQLTLRIKTGEFLRFLEAQGIPVQDMPVTRPLCGDLIVSYAFDQDEAFVSATPALLKAAGIDAAQVHTLATRNLEQCIARQGVRLLEEDGLYMVCVGQQGTMSNLEATLLCMDAFWPFVAKEIDVKGEILACVPSRDYLLLADGARPETHAGLHDLAKQLQAKAGNHGLSEQLMVCRQGIWSCWPA